MVSVVMSDLHIIGKSLADTILTEFPGEIFDEDYVSVRSDRDKIHSFFNLDAVLISLFLYKNKEVAERASYLLKSSETGKIMHHYGFRQ